MAQTTFPQNSFFQSSISIEGEKQAQEAPGSVHVKAPAVSRQQIEAWAHQARSMADEAGDGGLLALETDLLDLRDELLHLID